MTTMTEPGAKQRLVLEAATAADLMNANPISVAANVSVRQATIFLINNAFSAAPVIDEAGKPVGVLSQTDLLIHRREAFAGSPANADFYAQDDLVRESRQLISAPVESFDPDESSVRDVMTPVVFSVSPTTSANKVVEQLLRLGVHRLFVVDEAGILVGIVSTVDVLKKLRPEGEARSHSVRTPPVNRGPLELE